MPSLPLPFDHVQDLFAAVPVSLVGFACIYVDCIIVLIVDLPGSNNMRQFMVTVLLEIEFTTKPIANGANIAESGRRPNQIEYNLIGWVKIQLGYSSSTPKQMSFQDKIDQIHFVE